MCFWFLLATSLLSPPQASRNGTRHLEAPSGTVTLLWDFSSGSWPSAIVWKWRETRGDNQARSRARRAKGPGGEGEN